MAFTVGDAENSCRQLEADNEQLSLHLAASRTLAQQLASDYEVLEAEYAKVSVTLEQVHSKTKTWMTWIGVPDLFLSTPSRIAVAVVMAAAILALYLVTYAQRNAESPAIVLAPSLSSPEPLAVKTYLAELEMTTSAQMSLPAAIPTSLPTAIFTASPTPVPTATPIPTPTPTRTPQPTPTLTPFTYPTIAYNYDTRRGEGWEDYQHLILGLPVLWTGKVTHIPWFGGDVSVDVGQNDGWRDVTLEMGDSTQRELLKVGDNVTFRAIVKSVDYSFGLETRLSEVQILDIATATPAPAASK